MTALTSATVRQPRPRKPKMTTDLHEYIRRRDRMCFLYRLDQSHICASQWGVSHSPFNLGALTVDHVGMTTRPSDCGPRTISGT